MERKELIAKLHQNDKEIEVMKGTKKFPVGTYSVHIATNNLTKQVSYKVAVELIESGKAKLI